MSSRGSMSSRPLLSLESLLAHLQPRFQQTIPPEMHGTHLAPQIERGRIGICFLRPELVCQLLHCQQYGITVIVCFFGHDGLMEVLWRIKYGRDCGGIVVYTRIY